MDVVTPEPNATGVAPLDALFYAHVDAVFNVALRVLWNRGDAEDVVQQTFIRAITQGEQLRDPTRVRPWLLQVAYRQAIGVIRSRRDQPMAPESIPEHATEQRGPAESAISNDIANILNSALQSMKPEERMAVVLRDIEGLAMSEVAEVLAINLSAAKMRVHRGRAALRIMIAPMEVN